MKEMTKFHVDEREQARLPPSVPHATVALNMLCVLSCARSWNVRGASAGRIAATVQANSTATHELADCQLDELLQARLPPSVPHAKIVLMIFVCIVLRTVVACGDAGGKVSGRIAATVQAKSIAADMK